MKENSAIIQVQLPVEVATFLLNEKRADIHKIEERMGVEVVLIPNIHLETPNYNIIRIKHDDVNEDTSKASYQMVELRSETTYVTKAAEEAKAVKPVAAVKGITPTAPAPMSVEKVEPKVSLFAKIKKFFGLGEKSEAEIAAEKSNEARRDNPRNNRNRNERNRNRNERNRNERGDKNANQDRAPKNADQKTQEPRQAEVKSQEPRQQKPQQQRNDNQRHDNKNQESTRNVAQANVGEASANESTEQRSERSSRRNRNNRRNRRDRDESVTRDNSSKFVPNDEANSAASTNTVDVASVATSAEPVASDNVTTKANTALANVVADKAPVAQAPVPVTETVTKAKEVATPDSAPTSTANNVESTASESTPVEKVAKKSKPQRNTANKAASSNKDVATSESEAADGNVVEATESKAEKKRPARPRKTKAEPKKIDLADSGLQLVETKADAAKAITPVEVEKRSARKPASWQKEQKAEAGNEPLVMVETQNK
jgi:ribonuclease E